MSAAAISIRPRFERPHSRRARVGGRGGRVGRSRTPFSLLSWLGRLLSDVRLAFSAFVVCGFVIGSSMCAPREHQWLDGGDVAISRSVSADTVAVKAPVGKGSSGKTSAPALCSGHCASHFMSLPVNVVPADAPDVLRTAWVVFDDPRTLASFPPRLERPPRA